MGIPASMRILVGLVCVGLMVSGASGCAFSRGDLGEPLSDNDISTIKKGKTTESDVVALLGAPNGVEKVGNQEVFHYYRYTLKHGTVLVFSRVNIASDDLYVFFDSDDVVSQVLVSHHTDDLKFQFWPFGG